MTDRAERRRKEKEDYRPDYRPLNAEAAKARILVDGQYQPYNREIARRDRFSGRKKRADGTPFTKPPKHKKKGKRK